MPAGMYICSPHWKVLQLSTIFCWHIWNKFDSDCLFCWLKSTFIILLTVFCGERNFWIPRFVNQLKLWKIMLWNVMTCFSIGYTLSLYIQSLLGIRNRREWRSYNRHNYYHVSLINLCDCVYYSPFPTFLYFINC